MATFTVSFTAPQPDTYTCGWREQGSLAAHTIETVVITNPAALPTPGIGTFTITIPSADNVYCDNHDYEGYVIADCQDQTLDPITGVPINAVVFSASFIQQTDPCPLYEISCDNVPIQAVTVSAAGGPGYVTGESLTFTTVDPADTIVAAVGTIIATAGAVTGVTITNFGSYRSIPTIGVTSPSGSGATFSVLMQPCPNLITSAFACGSVSLPPIPTWESASLGESFELCTDVASLASLPSQFAAVDNSAANGTCNCIDCSRCTVTNTGAKGIRIQWQVCHTDITNPIVLMTQNIVADGIPVDIGCVIPGTVASLAPMFTGLSITYPGPC